MRFLCDVHIPFKLVNFLGDQGFETKHVNDLPNKWLTTDKEISEYCDKNDLVLITKDKDFKDSYLIKKEPKKLIKIDLGNVSTVLLISLFSENITAIAKLEKLESTFLCEIGLLGTNWRT